MALRIFLIFCIKLRDYKGRKVTEPDLWKKFLIWRYSRKRLQIRCGVVFLQFASPVSVFLFELQTNSKRRKACPKLAKSMLEIFFFSNCDENWVKIVLKTLMDNMGADCHISVVNIVYRKIYFWYTWYIKFPILTCKFFDIYTLNNDSLNQVHQSFI